MLSAISNEGFPYPWKPDRKLSLSVTWFDRKVLVTAKITIRGGEGGTEEKGKSFGQPTLIVSAAGNR